MIVHGDDFTFTGSTKSLQWLKAQFESKFKITAKILGPELGREHEIHVLNHVMRWESGGIVYEPDQRHAEMVVSALGLEAAGSVFTPGTRAEHEAVSEDLGPQDATRFRGLAAT